MTNRTTLITGATSGIGRAAARLFASQGSNLLLLARDLKRLESLKLSIEKEHFVHCTILQQDVRETTSLRSRLSEILRTLPLDCAIINAGIGQYGSAIDSRWEDLEDVLCTNVNGAIAVAHTVLPFLADRSSSSLVFISSVLGKRAMPYNAVYCASKFALQGFAEALRLEMKPHGVHVATVCPARTDTEFFDRMTYSVQQTNRRNVPTRSPEAVAEVILETVRSRKREAIVSTTGKLYAFVGYHFPRMTDFLFSRAVPNPDARPKTMTKETGSDSHGK